jgi:glycosyltransferase involved in cell wall biosynthesis
MMPARRGSAGEARILANREWIRGKTADGRSLVGDALPPLSAPWWRKLKAVALWRYEAVIIQVDAEWVLLACVAKKLIPFVRCRIMCVDLILTRPDSGLLSRAKFLVRRWLLREVDRFVFYFRQTDELQHVYDIASDRIRYVPFKPNTRDALLAMQTSDDGYFLSCGRSNRDLETLFEAFRHLPYECRVLARWSDLEHHGTRIDGLERPENVRLISDDGSVDSWNAWIARARAVVLPIQPGALSPSGIGSYLVAMALNKCVIITKGPATWQILSDSNAVLVPPRDASSLARAVTRVAEDRKYRESVAANGREYALSLGGESRLQSDLIRELVELIDRDDQPLGDGVTQT